MMAELRKPCQIWNLPALKKMIQSPILANFPAYSLACFVSSSIKRPPAATLRPEPVVIKMFQLLIRLLLGSKVTPALISSVVRVALTSINHTGMTAIKMNKTMKK